MAKRKSKGWGGGVWWNHQQFVLTKIFGVDTMWGGGEGRMGGRRLKFAVLEHKHGPSCSEPVASVSNLWHKHTCTLCPPLPQWRMLLTSRDIVILGREHNWVNMSVLCVLSDMTPGCSSGAQNTLIEGFILQSHCIVHYSDACFNIIN